MTPLLARRATCALLLAMAVSPAMAASPTIRVTDGWTRPAARGANAAGYVVITNTGHAADRLLSAESPAAANVTLHESRMEGGMMTMRPLDGVAVRAGQSVALKPGGMHLMLEGLTVPLTTGARIPVTLIFAKAGPTRVTFTVRLSAPQAAMGSMPM